MILLVKKRKSNLRLLFSVIFTISLVTNQCIQSSNAVEPLLDLKYRILTDNRLSGYCGLYISQYLRAIGIELEVTTDDWGIVYPPPGYSDSDMLSIKLTFKNREPDFSFLKQMDFWKLFPSSYWFPYKEELEEMIRIGPTIESKEERINHYQMLQEFFMDKILLYWPLMVENSFESLYNNTMGYDSNWGWVESSPYMTFNGLHYGQVSTNEFIFADANWRELNPLFTADSSSKFIWDFMAEPLIKIDPSGNPTMYGLVSNWIQHNSSHFQFFMRPNIYWTPSYNVTGRIASSDPLQNATLMSGLKGEYSTGTNQIVTAKDAVFTLLTWANPTVSEQYYNYEWLQDVYVDSVNPLSFHVLVDGNPNTTETEYYSLLFEKLEISCLPEFFLNSTEEIISYTTTGIECMGLYSDIENSPAWVSFSTTGFSCGKFMLDYYIRNLETVLRRNPFWYGVGAMDGVTGQEPFVETVKVRVIPDISAELAEFKAGKLDRADVSHFPAERKQMETSPLYEVYVTGPYYFHVLAFNVLGKNWDQFNDIWITEQGYENYTVSLAIRKAICHAIDKYAIANLLLDDYFQTDCMLPPQLTDWFYEDIQTKYEYDLIEAFKWMKLAGFNVTIPTSSKTSTLPVFTTINLEILYSSLGIVIVYLLGKTKRRK